MHILGLVSDRNHVCARYRLGAFARHWEARGVHLELAGIPSSLWGRLSLLKRVRQADAVVMQRKLFSRWTLTLLRRAARRLIFDFDDAVFQRDSYSPYRDRIDHRTSRFIAMVQAADAVIAGNEFLATEAARFAPANRIHVIPTCIDPLAYVPAEHLRERDGVQLVWIGSSSTLKGLERRRPLFDVIARHLPCVQLKIVCDRFPRFRRMPLVNVPWSAETETGELAAADVGVSWVPDDRWSRGKCGLKVLQYMAAGLPVIANPVGVQAELVRPGVTGFLARTPDEWIDAVRSLAADPALRRRMGAAGRRLVEHRYSVAVGAQQWLDLLLPHVTRLAA